MDISNEQETALLFPKYGIPAAVRDKRTAFEKQLAMFFILASTLFERIAFYSLVNNIDVFFPQKVSKSDWNWNPLQSSTGLLLLFYGISYISTIIFAIISDAKLGRARTIIIGFTLYVTGYALITTVATGMTSICPFNTTEHSADVPMSILSCTRWILGTVIIIAVGAGAVKANIVVFGAEQIQQDKMTSRYFDRYIVAANIGTMIATLSTPFIQKTWHDRYFIPNVVAGSMLVISAVLFLIGYRYYIHVRPFETVVANCIPVIINAYQSRTRFRNSNRVIDVQNTNSSQSTLLNASQSMSSIGDDRSMRDVPHPSSFLDFAKVPIGKFHDRIVDDVKSLRGAFIVFSLLIPYWLVYNQIDTTFQYQGNYMNGSNPETVTWMSLGDPVIIIVGILIFNLFVYKCLDARNWSLSIVRKFVIGMAFACVAMFTAGGIELLRLHDCHNNPEVSDLSIFYQLPQSILIGLSQLFAMVASYEYAYFAAPLSAQSLFMSLHFFVIGVASLIGTAYMALISHLRTPLDFSCFAHRTDQWTQWFSSEHFFIVGGLQLIFVIIFIVCQNRFQIVKLNPQQVKISQ